MIFVAALALTWHLGVLGITKLVVSRRNNPSLSRVLRLIEIDLIKNLRRKLRELPREKREKPPYKTWLKESEHRLGRLQENHEKSS